MIDIAEELLDEEADNRAHQAWLASVRDDRTGFAKAEDVLREARRVLAPPHQDEEE